MTLPRLALCAALAALPALAGCAGSPPWVIHRSADSITLRWYADNTPTAAANGAAARFCAMTGRAVRLGQVERDGSAAIGRYHCG